VRARYLIVSFNSEGFIAREDMEAILGRLGTLETREIRYSAFKGSRNLRERSLHVSEYLFVVRRR
jgi:adenine-specific DNA-methyltransferase